MAQRGDPPQAMDQPLKHGCDDQWCWNMHDKSPEVQVFGLRRRTAYFQHKESRCTAGVRGTRVLNHGRHYWEVRVSQREFRTAMMFGIATRKARLHVDAPLYILGEDEQSWGISDQGTRHHDGGRKRYTEPFHDYVATTVGLFFDGVQGTLTVYKDGQCLGVVFSGLHKVDEALYPVVCCSEAGVTDIYMTLGALRRDFLNLQDRCREVILHHLHGDQSAVNLLSLPNRLQSYLLEDPET